MTFDKDRILAEYAIAKTVNGVAAHLGYHYNTVRKVVMEAQGLCICGKPLVPNRKQCEKCLEDRVHMMQAKRLARKQTKRCTVGSCRQPLSPDSTRCCAYHLELARERQRTYSAKLKARRGEDQTWRNGWRAWREAAVERDNHRCILCNREGPRLSVHHIDGNRRHNEMDNLATLCIVCHSVVTRLLEHPTPSLLLDFMRTHYGIALP